MLRTMAQAQPRLSKVFARQITFKCIQLSPKGVNAHGGLLPGSKPSDLLSKVDNEIEESQSGGVQHIITIGGNKDDSIRVFDEDCNGKLATVYRHAGRDEWWFKSHHDMAGVSLNGVPLKADEFRRVFRNDELTVGYTNILQVNYRKLGDGRFPGKWSAPNPQFTVSLVDSDMNKPQDPIGLCVVCLDRRANVVLWPCGHVCMCQQCEKDLPKNDEGEKICPMSRCVIEQSMRFWLCSSDGVADGGGGAGGAGGPSVGDKRKNPEPTG